MAKSNKRRSTGEPWSPNERADWSLVAKRARRHAKDHPDDPDVILQRTYSPSMVTRLRSGEVEAFTPTNRWLIRGVNRDKVDHGKVTLLIRFHTKDKADIYY